MCVLKLRTTDLFFIFIHLHTNWCQHEHTLSLADPEDSPSSTTTQRWQVLLRLPDVHLYVSSPSAQPPHSQHPTSRQRRPGMTGPIPLISANMHVHEAERPKKEMERERDSEREGERRINECDHVTEVLLDMTQIEAKAQNADYGKSGTFSCCVQGYLLSPLQHLNSTLVSLTKTKSHPSPFFKKKKKKMWVFDVAAAKYLPPLSRSRRRRRRALQIPLTLTESREWHDLIITNMSWCLRATPPTPEGVREWREAAKGGSNGAHTAAAAASAGPPGSSVWHHQRTIPSPHSFLHRRADCL